MTTAVSPKVSIGVPTYNRPIELARCLESLVGQTYRNLEIIVSDNASEGTRVDEVVKAVMERDLRVRYVKQPTNKGALQNFQFLLDVASGDYFMWAGDDDYRDHRYVETLLNHLLEKPNCSMAFCDFAEVAEDGSLAAGYPRHFELLEPFTLLQGRMLAYFMQLESKGKANLIYGLMRRSALVDFRWDEFSAEHGPYGIDMLFVFRMLGHGPLALSRERLYCCTVGNVKHYESALPKSFASKLAGQVLNLGQQLKYATQYFRLARGMTAAAIAMALPFKLVDILVRLFLAVEIRNMRARIARWSAR